MAKTAKKQSAQSSDDFIPASAISGGAASYMKLQQGENTVRIISKPIVGWIEWVDDGDGRKPQRSQIDEEPEGDDENKPKKFMTVVVIDRNDDDKVKIMELTQQSIIKAIQALTQNPKWGKPFTYDICISKSGEDLKTKYNVTPEPKSALSKQAVKNASSKPCNLDAMFEGADPWNTEDGETEYFFK